MAVSPVRPDLDNPGARRWLWILLVLPVLVFVVWIIEQLIMSP